MATVIPIKYVVTIDTKSVVAASKRAKSALKAIEDGVEGVERETKKAKKEAVNFKDAWDGVKKVTAGSGSQFAGVAAGLGDMGEGMAQIGAQAGAFGAVGIAAIAVVGGLVLAATATAKAAVVAVDTAKAWDELTRKAAEVAHEMAFAGLATEDTVSRLDAAVAASDDVGTAFDLLTVSAGSALAPAFEELGGEVAGMLVALSDIVDMSAPTIAMLADMKVEIDSLGLSFQVFGLTGLSAYSDMGNEATKAGAKMRATEEKREEQMREIKQHLKDVVGGYKDLVKAAEDAERAQAKAWDATNKNAATAVRRQEEEIEAYKKKVRETRAVDEREATAQSKDKERMVKEDEKVAAEQKKQAEKATAARSENSKRSIQAEQEYRDGATDAVFAAANSTLQTIDMVLDARLSALDLSTRKGRDAARKVFAMQKATAIAGVAISTAQSVMQNLSAYPMPWAWIPAGAAIAVGTAQAAVIASQPPPFMTGGMVPAGIAGQAGPADHMPISAMPGEAILNRRAVEALGEQTVDRMNRGQGNQSPQIIVIPTLQHRMFDAFVADNMASGGPLSKRFDKMGNTGRVLRNR
jgi:hypothetical protein